MSQRATVPTTNSSVAIECIIITNLNEFVLLGYLQAALCTMDYVLRYIVLCGHLFVTCTSADLFFCTGEFTVLFYEYRFTSSTKPPKCHTRANTGEHFIAELRIVQRRSFFWLLSFIFGSKITSQAHSTARR